MIWIIDEFMVKPTGFLASWRYMRVLITDTGGIVNLGVPGKEIMNLPCIADYRKTNRRYKPGDLVTTFCDTTTFINYRVYAQDCTPFVYVQTDLNFPACGYITPLPTPGLPPITTVFPPPTYGLYKYVNDCNIDHSPLIINLYRKNYSGSSSQITKSGKSPVIISYKEVEKKERWGIQTCECIFSFITDSNFDYSELYTNDEREFKIEVIDNGVTKFIGFVTPDNCLQPFQSAPTTVTIRANDTLGGLKNVTYPFPTGTKSNLRQRFIDILSFALYQTGLSLNIYTVNNLYEQKMLTGLSDDPMAQSSVNPLRMSDGQGNIYNSYDVIEALCKQFYAVFRQVDGAWHFIRNSELPNEVIRRRVYNSTGFLLRGENYDPLRTAGQSQDVEIINANASLSIGNAYKRVEVLLKYGDIPSIIFNGDFESWDGSNFTFWSKHGGIDVTRIQRTVVGSGGAPVGILNYALQFNKKADIAKWIEADSMPVANGDKLEFSFKIGPLDIPGQYLLKARIRVGPYYLGNDLLSANPDAFTWNHQFSTASFYISGAKNIVNYSIALPDIPITGDMFIFIFGFYDIRTGFENNDLVNWIDDVSLNKNSQLEKNSVDGIVSISDQNAFYTDKPDTLEIIYGDYDASLQQVVRPSLAINPTIENNMFAIYTADGSYSKGWYEYGMSNSPAIMGLSLARSILKANQKPNRHLFGDFKGDNLSINDVYQISLPNEAGFSSKKFSILSGDFDLKFKELLNANLVEILNKNIVTNDANIPHTVSIYGVKEQLSMSIDQNPNNQVQTGGGIFTEQFTQEFS